MTYDNSTNRYNFNVDGKEISIQAQKGPWAKFKRWLGNNWLGRKITTGNFGAIKTSDGKRFLDKTSLIRSVSEYIILKQTENTQIPKYIVDALKHDTLIGKKIIKYICEGGEKKGIDIKKAESLLENLLTSIAAPKKPIKLTYKNSSKRQDVRYAKDRVQMALDKILDDEKTKKKEEKTKKKEEKDLKEWDDLPKVKVEDAKLLIRSQIPQGYQFKFEISESDITKIQKSLVDNNKLQIGDSEKEITITNEIVKQIFEKIGKHALSYVTKVDFEGCKGLKMNGFLSTLLEYCPKVKSIKLRNCGLNEDEIQNAFLSILIHHKHTLDELDLSNNLEKEIAPLIKQIAIKQLKEKFPNLELNIDIKQT